jgi:HK97 family phage portal protein
MPMNDDDEKSIWSALKRKIGGAKSMNAMRFSRRSLNVQQLNASSTDMQTIENKNQLTRDLCNVFGYPSMLLTGEQSTYNNVKEAERSAYYNNFIPTFEKIAAGYERKFLSKFGNYALSIHKEKIEALNPSPTERSNQAIKLVDAGLITPNEARESIGREMLTDEGMNQVKPKGSNVTISNV